MALKTGSGINLKIMVVSDMLMKLIPRRNEQRWYCKTKAARSYFYISYFLKIVVCMFV